MFGWVLNTTLCIPQPPLNVSLNNVIGKEKKILNLMHLYLQSQRKYFEQNKEI